MINWLCHASFQFPMDLFMIPLLTTLLPLSVGTMPKCDGARKSPVILVPGFFSSQIEAKLDKTKTTNVFCQAKTNDYFTLWAHPMSLFPYALDCWADNLSLVYDNKTRKTSNAPGVYTRIPGFGSTESIETPSPFPIIPVTYFHHIVKALMAIGYYKGIDVKGAPYDFRKAPNELADYYYSLKKMTEEMYRKNGNTPVTFICHSLGCPVILYFFNHQTQQWKDMYVKSFITLNGGWGGTVRAMSAYVYGENYGLPGVNRLIVRKAIRTFPSLAYMLPSNIFWSNNEVLIETNVKNYTTSNFYDFFMDIGVPDGWKMYKDTHNLTLPLTPPGVEVHCIHGSKKQTIERTIYRKQIFPDGGPSIEYGDGDGYVNLRSLQGCLQFQGKQKKAVHYTVLQNAEHFSTLDDNRMLNYVQKVVKIF